MDFVGWVGGGSQFPPSSEANVGPLCYHSSRGGEGGGEGGGDQWAHQQPPEWGRQCGEEQQFEELEPTEEKRASHPVGYSAGAKAPWPTSPKWLPWSLPRSPQWLPSGSSSTGLSTAKTSPAHDIPRPLQWPTAAGAPTSKPSATLSSQTTCA